MKNPSLSPIGRTCLLAVASMMMLAGCGKKSVTPDAEIKPVAYYVERPDELEKALTACLDFKQGPYTTLNADERDIADRSDWAMNCNNVGEAMMAARAKRQREAAARFSQ